MSAIGYVRLSPGERAAGGLGIAAQKEAIAAHAAKIGLELRLVCEDAAKSGGKDMEARPGLVEAVQALEAGDVLLVAKSDRLSRGDPVQNAFIERAVEKRSATIVSADGSDTADKSPSAVFLRGIMQLVAQYERGVIGQRTKAALAIKKGRGERTGGVPFGKRLVGNKLVDEPRELEALVKMRELRSRGRSYRAIGRWLDGHEFPTKSGKPWQAPTVRKLLAAKPR